MADQGFRFQNLLGNYRPVFDASSIPTGAFQGGAFQSFLQPSAATTPEAWNRSPQSILKHRKDLEKQGYSKEDITSAEASSQPSPTPENQGIGRFYGALERSMDQQIYNQSPAGMREQLEMGKEMAKEQAKQTLKFQTLANLPGQITAAIAGNTSQIPEIYNRAYGSVPSMNIQAPGYSAPQMRYFS